MKLTSSAEIGALIRQVRKAQELTQAELAGACGVGVRFVIDLEHGKPSCELGKALRVLSKLGLKLNVEP